MDINFLDVYIDYSKRIKQIPDAKERSLIRRKMKYFTYKYINPLYYSIANDKKFKFSLPDDELTCRIIFRDICNYCNIKSMDEALLRIAENNQIIRDNVKKRH